MHLNYGVQVRQSPLVQRHKTATNERWALFHLDVEGIGVDMEEFRYSNHHWFSEQILTNDRLALFHLDDKGVQVQ